MEVRTYISFVMAALLWASAANGDQLHVTSQPIELDPRDSSRIVVGSMNYMGGLILNAVDRRFGGWSGIEVAPSGKYCVTVSDRGDWMKAELKYDKKGRLQGIGNAQIHRLRDVIGARLSGKFYSDAEDLIRIGKDRVLVSFEHAQRVWSYKFEDGIVSGRAKPVAIPKIIQKAPRNGGVEAMTVLHDGRVLMLVEKLRDDNNDFAGFIVNTETSQSRSLLMMHHQDYYPTAMATLKNGDVLILERQFVEESSQLFGRIRRVNKDSIRPRSKLAGKEMALFEPPMAVDNFEGMSQRSDEKGRTFVYLLSDNNFKPSQRTLLLQLEIRR
jgi:hypothetical protein